MAIENEQFNTVFTWATRGFDQLERTVENVALLQVTQHKLLRQFAGYRLAADQVSGFARTVLTPLRFMKDVLEDIGFTGARSLEQLATAFQGNQQAARDSLAWTSKFATQTASGFGEVTKAFTGFANFGIDAMKKLGTETTTIAGKTVTKTTNLMRTVANIAARTGRDQAGITSQIVQAVTSGNADALSGLVDRATLIHLKFSGALIGTYQDVADRIGRILNMTSAGAATRMQATMKGFALTTGNLATMFKAEMIGLFDEGGMFGQMRKWLFKSINEVLLPFFVEAGGIARVAKVVGDAFEPWATRLGKFVFWMSEAAVATSKFITNNPGLVKTFVNVSAIAGGMLMLASATLSVLGVFKLLSFGIGKIGGGWVISILVSPFKLLWGVLVKIIGLVGGLPVLFATAFGFATGALIDWNLHFGSIKEGFMWFKTGIREFFIEPFWAALAVFRLLADAMKNMTIGSKGLEFTTSPETYEAIAKGFGTNMADSLVRGLFAGAKVMPKAFGLTGSDLGAAGIERPSIGGFLKNKAEEAAESALEPVGHWWNLMKSGVKHLTEISGNTEGGLQVSIEVPPELAAAAGDITIIKRSDKGKGKTRQSETSSSGSF